MKKFAPLCWVIAVLFVALAYIDHHNQQREAIKATREAAEDQARREEYRENAAREAAHQQRLQEIRRNPFIRF